MSSEEDFEGTHRKGTRDIEATLMGQALAGPAVFHPQVRRPNKHEYHYEETMHDAAHHLSAVELEQGLNDVVASPSDCGTLVAIIIRPRVNERDALKEVRISLEGGIEGDRWVRDSYYKLENGGSDPRCQVSLMNARLLRQIAGDDERMCLAGDNLIVDLDLSEKNLPAGSQLAVGSGVVLEFSDLPHTGCSKFAQRYGAEARAHVNSEPGKALHLRGRYARVIRGGTVRIGDAVSKHTARDSQ